MAAAAGSPFDIPGYRIVRQLGQGGMATVYLATQTSLGRQVAVKVLAAERTPSEELIKRFENETRTIARLDHPHIVSIYEVGRASTGQLYYTLPYLPNGDLSARRFVDDPRGALDVLRCLAQALAYAHDQGIVHRDVKPENVLFDKLDRPLLADFGIALARHSDIRMTREGATLGSTGYMSPEQARGLAIDGRSDLYSLGIMAYEMLTGDLPFHGPDALSVALAHVEQPVPRLPPKRRAWQTLIDRTLAKNPDERYQNAAEMLTALDLVEDELDGRRRRPAPDAGWRERLAAVPPSLWVGLSAIAGTAMLLGMLLWPTAPQGGDTIAGTAPPSNLLQRLLVRDDEPAAPVAPAPVAPPPGPDAAEVRAKEIAQRLDAAAPRMKAGKLIAPAGDNAAEDYLAVLALEPANPAATQGVADIIKSLGDNVDTALRKNNLDGVRDGQQQARMLAERAVMLGTPAWTDFLAARRKVFDNKLDAATKTLDRNALAALQPFAEALGADQPELLAAWRDAETRLSALPGDGAPVSDAGGPVLVFVPASYGSRVLDHPFAIGRVEVTKAQYAAFARATGRAEARCREPLRPLSRLKSLSWRDPDFSQTDEEPAVCVSWLDAHAYVRWLSKETGATYRLPTEAEWLHAAQGIGRGDTCRLGNVADASMGSRLIAFTSRYKCSDGFPHTAPVGRYNPSQLGIYDLAGNVGEWTLDCGSGAPLSRLLQDDACPERIFRGTSWRDGPDEEALTRRGAGNPDVGYTTIGFRVLREVTPDSFPTAMTASAR